MNFKSLLLSLTCFLFVGHAMAQDTLPNFTVEDKGGGRIIISWQNPFENLVQIAVQRSYDSTKRFSTVYASTSPELPVNGYSDKIVPGVRMYYRIFYVMKGGTYYFTQSKRAGTAGIAYSVTVDSRRDQLAESFINALKQNDSAMQSRNFAVQLPEENWTTLSAPSLLRFRDSVLTQTRDTLYQVNDDTLVLARYTPPFAQSSSEYVQTNQEGYIVITLADAASKRYTVSFFEENGTPVLEIKPKEGYLILDKTNFYHGGWYKFEIKDAGRIVERNRVFLPRDF